MDLPTAATSDEMTVSAQARRPGVWSGLGFVALYFLLQLGLSILISAAIGFGLALKAGFAAGLHHHRPDMRAIAQTMRANPDISIIVAMVTIAAAAAIMALLVRQFWPGQWSRADLPGFGFAPPADKLAFPGAIVLGFVMLLLGGAITHLLAGQHPVHQDVAVMAGKVSLDMRILLAVLVVCVAPFVEELVFRGVLLSGLASRMRVGWAILVSAIVFGCVHLPDFGFAWYPVPALVLLGLVLAWLRVRTRSLWPSITLHAANNFFAVLAWFLVTKPH
ncbi:MAG TPA: CPBP family intramembrane glutamic endopeptidase [Rhodanobacteraceae bacterium]